MVDDETPLDGLNLSGARIASVGECMVELSDQGGAHLHRAFGGDTLNTAIYLARLGARVDYVTVLGDDPYSDEMVDAWQREGVGTDQVQRRANRVPGLYIIRTDGSGERQFLYWRDQAPARDLFSSDNASAMARVLRGYDILYLSGISLSLYGPEGRARLADILDDVRAAGTCVAFDPNFRPAGWPDREAARDVFKDMESRCDLALPGMDDDATLFDGPADAEATARRFRAAGAREVVVKCGSDGMLVSAGDSTVSIPTEPVDRVVDTTAAGDSFNAGYIAARLGGNDPKAAARAGAKLAAAVIGHHGAVIPADAMPAFHPG